MHQLPLNRRKVHELVRQAKHFNIFPIYLPRYHLGEPDHPISGLLGELVEEAFECLSIAEDEEVAALLDSLPPGMTMIMGRRPEWGSEEQKRSIAVMYVATEIQRSYYPFKGVVDEIKEDSEVLQIYPELERRFDKDGLLRINDDFTLHAGGIEYKDHVLHYHQLLRRSYTSNPNFDFIGRLLAYRVQTKSTNKFRIAIDHRRIMPKEFFRQMMELDAWFGPSFDARKLDDPKAVGLTVIKRNKNSLFERTNQLDRTEFIWSFRNRIKTFQIEEISDQDYTFDHYCFNKYVHSERDTEREITRHVDGAVKVYLKDAYLERIETRMPNEPKCHKKIKLWRIDGDIDLESWTRLISFFFKGNEMVIRYFNPQEYEERFELRVRDFEAWKRQQPQRGENK